MKVKFNDNDNIFKTGRLQIKNRVKSFDIQINTTKAGKKDSSASFLIQMSVNESNFTKNNVNKLYEYQLNASKDHEVI